VTDGERLREAARQALPQLGSRSADGASSGGVDRVTLDIVIGDRREVVTVRLQQGALCWSCTCGTNPCEHVQVALTWIGGAPAEKPVRERTEIDLNRAASAWSHLSWPPDLRTIGDFDQAARINLAALANYLEELIVTAARTGSGAGLTEGVAGAINRLIELMPRPVPVGVSRWIGRLRVAFEDHSVEGVARLLHGASRLVADLRLARRDPVALERFVSWLGAHSDDKRTIERISDRSLLEVAREWMDGTERADIEKRYLVDLNDGEIFLEERTREQSSASLGPCPRLVTVGLAVAEQGARPRRIRLLQYATAVSIPAESWGHVSAWASRAFAPLRDVYQQSILKYPGLSEPFAVIAPARLVHDPLPVPLDESGHPLPLAAARDPYAIRVLDALASNQRPEWIAGRLVDAQGTLMMRPLSMAVVIGGELRHFRL
jgi:hypothetical protein